MDATKSESWNSLGRKYIEVKEGTRAVAAFNKALQLDGENPLLWWSLAEGYCCLNDKEKCIDGVRKVGVKLEKLVGDVRRREDEMRKAKTAAEDKAKGASTAMAKMQASQQQLEVRLSQASGCDFDAFLFIFP